MATNKHAVIRYQTLDKCFRNPGKRYFIEDLIEECDKSLYEFTGSSTGIQKRQIFDDIRFMESKQGWSIDLERRKDGRRVYYRYADHDFSINNHLLNETEENQLKETLQTLSRFKGLPQFEWIEEITARLDSSLRLSGSKTTIIEFDQNNYLKGLEFISPLYDAILYQRVMDVEYKSFRKEEKQNFIFHPYFLKEYNNRWFVFGKNDTSGFIINLALDRMVALKDCKKKFISNTEINFQEYFEDIIGVSLNNNATAEKITLKVSSLLYPYIKSKPIHGSQKVKEIGREYSIITLNLIPNYELESLILSFGEGMEVLTPQSLRTKIKERVNLMNKNYKNNSADRMHYSV